MKNLIRAEFFKLKKSTPYKVLFFTYLFTEAAIQVNNIGNSVAYPKYNPTYTGAEWLQNLHQSLLLYSVVIFCFTAFFVNGDFLRHTFYSGLLCGTSRRGAFLAKIVAVLSGAVLLMFVPLVTGTVLWSVHAGFGMAWPEAIRPVARAFAIQLLASLMLVSNAVFFSVIAKSKIGAFLWSFGTLYVLGVLRGNIGHIIKIPVLRDMLLFVLSLCYLNLGVFLISIVLKLLISGYLFERCDLK